MTAVSAVNPKLYFPQCPAGTVDVYIAGTASRTNTWQDRDQTTLNTNPINLNSRGECVAWLDSAIRYRFVVKNAGGVTVYTVDDVAGAQPGAASVAQFTTDTFSGTGAQTVFTLSVTPSHENATNVFVGGVYQKKGTYSLSGANLTFSVAPASGTDNIEVVTASILDYTDVAADIAASVAAAAASETAAATSETNAAASETAAAASATAADASADAAALSEIAAAGNTPDGRGVSVTDYTALRAYSGVATTVKVLNSGVGGDFVYDSTDTTSADNDGTIIVASNGKRWKRIFAGLVSVKWFGAVGDGATNDSAAIQAAIDAVVAAGGGTLHFPSGTYQLTTGLTITRSTDGGMNMRLQGAGPTFLRTSAAIDMLTISNTNAGVANTRRIVVDGIGFACNNAAGRGLVLTKASYNQFTNLDFTGVGDAIIVGTTANDTYTLGNQFSNIRCTATKTGMLFNGQHNIATNIVISEGLSGGAYGIKFDGSYNSVTGFYIRGAGGVGGNGLIDIASNGSYTTMSDGYISEAVTNGIRIISASDVQITNVAITLSQQNGLVVFTGTRGRYNVNIGNSSTSSPGTYSQVSLQGTPSNNVFNCIFSGTEALYDFLEPAGGSNNTFIAGSLPNGASLSGTDSVLFAAGAVTSKSSTGIGYLTGAGGTVTQLTDKTTGVTLSKATGQITMNNAALAADTTVSFTLTNTAIAAGDHVIIQHVSGGTVGSYTVTAVAAAGSATVYVRNVTAGSLSEAIVLKFTVFKSATT